MNVHDAGRWSFVVAYRDSQAQRVQHPRGHKADRDRHHHEDQREPVHILQADMEILGGLVCNWCKGQPHLGRNKQRFNSTILVFHFYTKLELYFMQ